MDREILVVIALVILVLLNLRLWLYLWKRFFTNWAEFCEAFDYLFSWDLLSGLRGGLHDDLRATFKLYAFFAICAFSFACQYAIVYLLIAGYGD